MFAEWFGIEVTDIGLGAYKISTGQWLWFGYFPTYTLGNPYTPHNYSTQWAKNSDNDANSGEAENGNQCLTGCAPTYISKVANSLQVN